MVDYMVSTGRMPIAQPTDHLERRQPAYGTVTRNALVNYVASFAPGGPPIPTIELAHADLGQGSQLFQLNCAPCHSAAGSGGALLDQSAPDLHQSTPVQAGEAVRAGPSPMPVFGQAALTGRQLDDVVAYVQYLRHPDNRGGFSLDHLGPLPEGAVAIVFGLGVLICVTILIERRRRA
jgi:ubiquinol-cytochrome c reductase cytochrome c subunit